MLKESGVVGQPTAILCDHCGAFICNLSENLTWRPTYNWSLCDACHADGWTFQWVKIAWLRHEP